MMELRPVIQQVLIAPTPAALWELYGRLLATGADASLIELVGAFHHYLHNLKSKADARQYSEVASMLDIGAVGGVAVQNLIGGAHKAGDGANDLMKRFLMGTVSESLMVLASRQYVKGWQSELHSVHSQATWFLARELWQVSAEMQPDLPAEERWAHIDRLLTPARDSGTRNEVKAVFLGWLFQIVLLRRLAPLL
jgi:hypothetical protein